jgi:nicotinamidase-related amidase
MTETLDAIDPLRSALLVMDYQSGILERLENTDELVERAERAIALARSRGATVGYVRVAFADADYENVPRTSRMWTRVAQAGRAFHADAPATAIHERLAPEPGDVVVRKVRVGAFSTTDLDAQLRERGVDTLILAGISTSGVVLSTVRDASDRDYRVLVLRDVSADPQPDVHEFLTTRVFPAQAEVITLGELEDLLAPAAADG